MKIKYTHALAAVALVIPAMAMANDPEGPSWPHGDGPGGTVNNENEGGFTNKGQCQSALSHEINRQRKDPEERVASRREQKASDFQRDMKDRFECRIFEEGVYRVGLR